MSEYLIKCTYPKIGRNIREKPNDMNYPRCNSPYFVVKWDSEKQIAYVICSKCGRLLFENKLNMMEVEKDGQLRNINPSNNDDSTNISVTMGNNDIKETDKNTQ